MYIHNHKMQNLVMIHLLTFQLVTSKLSRCFHPLNHQQYLIINYPPCERNPWDPACEEENHRLKKHLWELIMLVNGEGIL